jgi:hypothetical protein
LKPNTILNWSKCKQEDCGINGPIKCYILAQKYHIV